LELTDLLCGDGQYEDAAEMSVCEACSYLFFLISSSLFVPPLVSLRVALEKNSAYLLRCYYGKVSTSSSLIPPSAVSLTQVLGCLKQYDKAIQELHFAMSSSAPGSDVSLAIQELDRIEGLLQGNELSISNDVGGYYDPSLKSVSPAPSL
jgi:hypothetical protein